MSQPRAVPDAATRYTEHDHVPYLPSCVLRVYVYAPYLSTDIRRLMCCPHGCPLYSLLMPITRRISIMRSWGRDIPTAHTARLSEPLAALAAEAHSSREGQRTG